MHVTNLNTTEYPHGKGWIWIFLRLYMNINLKLMMGINVKPKIIKILEENTEVNRSEFEKAKSFWIQYQKHKWLKNKTKHNNSKQ